MLTDPLDLVSSMALLHHPAPGADICGVPVSASLCVATDANFHGTQMHAQRLWIHSDLFFPHLLTRVGALGSHVLKVQVYNSFFVYTTPLPVSE